MILRYKMAHTYLLAGTPTSLYPSSVKATIEGVVLCPIYQNEN
jgi:hypothetical protein